ncbi:MAG: hypothetical protein ACKON9_28575, partial [Planctomycetaceae bacterium]
GCFKGVCSGWKARATGFGGVWIRGRVVPGVEWSGRRPVDEGRGGWFSGGFAWRGGTEYSVRRK